MIECVRNPTCFHDEGGKPVEEGVAHQLGEEEAERKLDHTLHNTFFR